MKRRLLSITLTVCMIISILSITGLAAEDTYSDTSGHWSNAAIERWSDYGVLSGYNGQFRPSDPITRAELASVLDKVMRYQDKSDVADFSDIDASAWYAPAILKLNAVGVMLGSDGKMRPNDNITREEAAVMIGRAFAVPENSGNENPFPDADEISGWASFLVDGMKAAGYISGYSDGSFGPKNTITRAEVVTILDKLVDYFYNESGEVDNAGISFSPKNVVINTSDVTLKNTAVAGDLYIAPGVGGGEVTLENVTVSGTTYIWGGGPNSVIANDCDFNVIRLDALTNPALKFSPDTKAIQVYLDNTATVTHGGVTVKYDAATDTVTFGGTIDKVMLNADGTATVSIGGIVYDVIPPEGTLAKFELAKDAVVKNMVINAPVNIGGEGKIEKMEVHTDGVVIDKSVDVKPENITVDKDVKVKVGDKEYTGDGKTLPPNNPPSDDGGSYNPPAPVTYSLTVSNLTTQAAATYGSATITTGAATGNTSGASVTVSATPEADYAFVKWVASDDAAAVAVSTANPYSFNITVNTTLYAVFETKKALADAEATKITGFTEGTHTASNLVLVPINNLSLTPGAVVNITSVQTGANQGSKTPTDWGASGLTLNTQNVVQNGSLDYVEFTFTVTLNGVTSSPQALEVSTLFSSGTTANVLKTERDMLASNLSVASNAATGTFNVKKSGTDITALLAQISATTNNNGHNQTAGIAIVQTSSGNMQIVFSQAPLTPPSYIHFEIDLTYNGTRVQSGIDVSIVST